MESSYCSVCSVLEELIHLSRVREVILELYDTRIVLEAGQTARLDNITEDYLRDLDV